MKDFLAKLKNNGIVNDLRYFLSSKYFPFITEAVTLLCYYLGWDIVLIYYISITGALMVLFLDDLTPVISHLLFMSVAVSYKNSPSPIMESSDYFTRTEILVQTVIMLSLFALAAAYRITHTFVRKKFKFTPAFFGIAAFSFVLLLNGAGAKDYTAQNFVYGLILALCFMFIFVGLKDNITTDKTCFEKLNLSFIALSVLLVIELTVKYFTVDGIIVNGEIVRTKLTFGWGMWNSMGMSLLLCIPSSVYLAAKSKYGFIYTLYSVLLLVATFMSCSRQAMLTVAVIYPACILILLIKGKNKIANGCIVAAALLAIIILCIIFRDTVVKYFVEFIKKLFAGGDNSGNGRGRLWREALNYFISYPYLGAGFHVKYSSPDFNGLSFIPLMCHNTVLEIMAACGVLGLITYAVHRCQTVVSFLKNVTMERTFLVLTVAGLLITSLFDNHIFYIFPTMIYSALFAVFTKSENKN